MLELGLVGLGGVEAVDAVNREARRLVATVRDLEVPDERAQDRADLARRVEQVFKVAEAVPLLGRVVDRVVWRRLRDADVVLDVVAGEIVVEAPERAPVLRARLDPGVAAAVHADIPARPKSPALGLDVHDAGGAQAELGGQRAGDKLDRIGEAGAQAAALAEQAHPIGQGDAVDAVLHVAVLVANVEHA